MTELLARYRPMITSAIAASLPADSPVERLLAYPLGLREVDGRPGPGLGGKLLRPSLVCFSCEALGDDPQRVLDYAVAIELVHVFSLVHDDLQDGDALRRGRPTTWAAFGKADAINAGDAMLVLALETVARSGSDAENRQKAIGSLLHSTFRMIEGQTLDLALQRSAGATVDAYIGMVARKTGALLGCALELGAIGARRSDTAPAHRTLGSELGVAFQIRDDLLSIWGSTAQMGKPAGAEGARGMHNLPLILAASRGGDLAERARRAGPESLGALLSSEGVRAETESMMRKSLDRCAEHLEDLPWTREAKTAFAGLMDFVADREV